MNRSFALIAGCLLSVCLSGQEGNGFLFIETEPEGASVIIDGTNMEMKTPFQQELKPGIHVLMLKHSTFPKYVDTIEIKSYETLKQFINLKPTFGSADISSNPSGVYLLIDGKEMGKTPILVDNLASGRHELILRNETYNLLNQEFFIEEGKTVRLNYDLVSGRAKVMIQSYPKRARISVDNVFVGFSPDTFSVTPGNHLVNLEKRNFSTFSRDMNIREGPNTYNIILSPHQFRHRGNAMLYSLFCPGTGQSYMSRKKAYGLLGLVGYGLVATTVYSYLNLNQNYDLYVAETDVIKRADLKEVWKDNLSQTQLLTISTAVFWGANLLWTAVIPTDKQRLERYKIKGEYLSNTRSASLGISYTF